MKTVILITTFFISLLSNNTVLAKNSKASPLTLKLESGTIKINFVEHQGLKISDNCLKKKNCDALRSGLAKFHQKPPPHEAMNHPAVLYCKGMGGKAFIAHDNKNNSVDVCQFPDETYLDPWTAFHKHYPPPTAQ
ncbi:MAG: DUF333 domain-containing protein [Bdellovibrionia bacterium]